MLKLPFSKKNKTHIFNQKCFSVSHLQVCVWWYYSRLVRLSKNTIYNLDESFLYNFFSFLLNFLMEPQRFSMGFISRLFVGQHLIKEHFFSIKKVVMRFFWAVAPSCLKCQWCNISQHFYDRFWRSDSFFERRNLMIFIKILDFTIEAFIT